MTDGRTTRPWLFPLITGVVGMGVFALQPQGEFRLVVLAAAVLLLVASGVIFLRTRRRKPQAPPRS
jgi:hypothetical protein